MHAWHRARKYLHYWLYAVNQYSLHEPFIYSLYTEVIKTHSEDPEIEVWREAYRTKTEPLKLTSLGASSTFTKRTLAQIAFNGSADPSAAGLLRKLFSFTNGTYAIELGTALGFTTCYLASVPGVEVYTLEGDPLLYQEAKKQLSNYTNIFQVEGNIDETLPDTLSMIPHVDFVFIDANHQLAPTVAYFELCLSHCHDDSVIVLDDIHWSPEMSEAWKNIKQHPRVSITVDLYHMGWVFLKPMSRRYDYIIH